MLGKAGSAMLGRPGDVIVKFDANERRVLGELCNLAVNDSQIGGICQIVIAGLALSPPDAEITFPQDAQLAGGLFGYVRLLPEADQPIGDHVLEVLFVVAITHRIRDNGNKIIITQP